MKINAISKLIKRLRRAECNGSNTKWIDWGLLPINPLSCMIFSSNFLMRSILLHLITLLFMYIRYKSVLVSLIPPDSRVSQFRSISMIHELYERFFSSTGWDLTVVELHCETYISCPFLCLDMVKSTKNVQKINNTYFNRIVKRVHDSRKDSC